MNSPPAWPSIPSPESIVLNRAQDDLLLSTTAPKYIGLTCVSVVALAMVLSVYYLMQKRRRPEHDPLPPGDVAIRHGHDRDANAPAVRRRRCRGRNETVKQPCSFDREENVKRLSPRSNVNVICQRGASKQSDKI